MLTPAQQDHLLSTRKPYENQAAGHDGVQIAGNLVIKPCSPEELAFYENAHSKFPEFLKWMPTFMGSLKLADENASDRFKVAVVMENLTLGFAKPSVLDIKLGRILTDENVSEEKRARMEKASRDTTSWELGLRITGMRVWRQETQEYQIYEKTFGKALKIDNVLDGLLEYFPKDNLQRAISLVKFYLQKIKDFETMLKQHEIRMFAASLCFAYEGQEGYKRVAPKDEEFGEDEDEVADLPENEIRLIDFAHATWREGAGPDDNTLMGVSQLIKLFEGALERLQNQ